MRAFVLFFLLAFAQLTFSEVVIENVWGKQKIDNPLIEALLDSPVLKRLKEIDQSGPIAYFGLAPYFSRYDHSVGVLSLLYKANVTTEESAAGLLHDASHTAFSHIADNLFHESNGEKSYQDIIHLEFLKIQGIDAITKQYGTGLTKPNPDLPEYRALEQHLPNLCADRIQYIIHTGVIFKKIVDNLQFKNGTWFFTSTHIAKKFAMLSLDFTQELWGAPWNNAFYEYFAQILKRSIELHLISSDEIKFKTDLYILNKLKQSEDAFIKNGLTNLHNIYNIFKVVPEDIKGIKIKPKFRGVDPLILIDGQYKRLSEVNLAFKEKFQRVKKWCKEGYGIKFIY